MMPQTFQPTAFTSSALAGFPYALSPVRAVTHIVTQGVFAQLFTFHQVQDFLYERVTVDLDIALRLATNHECLSLAGIDETDFLCDTQSIYVVCSIRDVAGTLILLHISLSDEVVNAKMSDEA